MGHSENVFVGEIVFHNGDGMKTLAWILIVLFMV
jgi:hypothetical protein